jgi:hypothetical protein
MSTTPVQTPAQLPEDAAASGDALSRWISIYRLSEGAARREARTHIKILARTYPWLADLIPEDVWQTVYCVRAAGTMTPYADKEKDKP